MADEYERMYFDSCAFVEYDQTISCWLPNDWDFLYQSHTSFDPDNTAAIVVCVNFEGTPLP